MTIETRLESLRTYMKDEGLDAYIVTGSDPHGSEIPPARWRTREWISGFTGSSGTVVVTSNDAGLWTDFRYWLQAAEELDGSGIRLFKEGIMEVPSPEEWLAGTLGSGAVAAVDGQTMPAGRAGDIQRRLAGAGIGFAADRAPWDRLWPDRPPLPGKPAVGLTLDETGESRAERLARLRSALAEAGADTWLGTALDSAAWLLNVRGADVPYVPVIAGFLIVGSGFVRWYTDRSKIPADLQDELVADGVEFHPYDGFLEGLASLEESAGVLVDKHLLSRGVLDVLPESVGRIEANDPVFHMKAVKNRVEVSNIARAMEKDGAAMVRYFRELGERLEQGDILTEIEAAALLLEKRRDIPGFLDQSFSPIPGVDAHGAIVHYEAREEGVGTLKKGSGLFLIDSGGQWTDGTTDITRTLSLGNPTDEQIRDYTLVLKGHIALSTIRFPRGTRGYQLDTLARMYLWRDGLDYGHGTGHGVGYRLNVHEGPHVFNTRPIDVPFAPGMVASNEPGLYREGRHGIRIENLIICREDEKNEFGEFLAFDTLTLAPYDPRLIDRDLLDESEISWVDAYHRHVFERLAPMLEEADRSWLREQTAPL